MNEYTDVKGRDSAVGIATRSGTDGTRIESQWVRNIRHSSTTAFGPTHPPIQCAPGHSWG